MTKTKTQTEASASTKAKSGTSLPARAKALVLSLSESFRQAADVLAEQQIFFPEISELHEVARGFSDTSSRNLPLTVQLQKATVAIKAVLQFAELVDGELVFADDADAIKYEALLTKKKRLHSAIAKENTPITNPE